MRRSFRSILLLAAALGMSPGSASALTLPFTEDFASSVSGWRNAASDPLTFVASGGPDGSSYASGQFNYLGFVSPFPGGGPVTFRGNASADASGGAFVGDWVAGGVTTTSAWVRHDAPVDLTFFLRVAGNAPGAIYGSSVVVAPNVWTLVTFDTSPGAPCTPEGGTCAGALAAVRNVQFGTTVPSALSSLDRAITLDIDQIAIVPEPGTLLLAGAGLAAVGATRRRSRS
jgi:hypothetical protein